MKELDLYLDYLNEQNVPVVATSVNSTQLGGTIGNKIATKLKGDKKLQTDREVQDSEPLFDQEEF